MKNTWTKLLESNGFTPTDDYNCKEVTSIVHSDSKEKGELVSIIKKYKDHVDTLTPNCNPYPKDYKFFGDAPKKCNIFVSVKILDNDRCSIEMDAQDWLSLIKQTPFVTKKFCKSCGSHELIKWGKTYKAVQRYFCQNCGKTEVPTQAKHIPTQNNTRQKDI